MQDKKVDAPSRRDFVKGATAAAVGAAVVTQSLSSGVFAAENNTLRIGLIGCGGRGSGAAQNALKADPNVKLVAMGDMFPDELEKALVSLKGVEEITSKIDVKDDHKFTGWDAYKGVIAASDVVLLATPPHFRPMHLRAVIDAGKHVFCEKPVAVDVPGVKKVIEACKLAKEKNLNLVSGLCYRYDPPKVETMKRIRDGMLGEIVALQGMYLGGGLWTKPRAEHPEWSDMEWQVRNWLYFTWLSGDHIVEQHIHTIDKMLWLMKDEPPVKCTSNGGRTVRTGETYGNIYDHFDTIYEWANGVRAFCQTRQWNGVDTDTSDWAFGTKGKTNFQQHTIWNADGAVAYKARAGINMYDAEHIALFKAIRSGQTINNGDYMTKATLMAIMGRMSAYTGKTMYWDKPAEPNPAIPRNGPFVMESKEDFTPPAYAFGPIPLPPVAVPGKTKFI